MHGNENDPPHLNKICLKDKWLRLWFGQNRSACWLVIQSTPNGQQIAGAVHDNWNLHSPVTICRKTENKQTNKNTKKLHKWAWDCNYRRSTSTPVIHLPVSAAFLESQLRNDTQTFLSEVRTWWKIIRMNFCEIYYYYYTPP